MSRAESLAEIVRQADGPTFVAVRAAFELLASGDPDLVDHLRLLEVDAPDDLRRRGWAGLSARALAACERVAFQ